MKVVMLQQSAALMQASGQAGVQNYDWNEEVTE